MGMTCLNNFGLFEEASGPSFYTWKNDQATYSSPAFSVITGKDTQRLSMPPLEQIQLILKFYGFSKTQLAAVLGISRPALYAWMDGSSEPSPENYNKLMAISEIAYEIDASPTVPLFHAYVDKLFPGYEKSLIAFLSEGPDNSQTIKNLVRNIYQLTLDRRKRLEATPKATYASESDFLRENLEL